MNKSRWTPQNQKVELSETKVVHEQKSVNPSKPKGGIELGDGIGNNIAADGMNNQNIFSANEQTAAANMYGTGMENSFDREIPPVTAIETNQDTTGMNSLYNKTI